MSVSSARSVYRTLASESVTVVKMLIKLVVDHSFIYLSCNFTKVTQGLLPAVWGPAWRLGCKLLYLWLELVLDFLHLLPVRSCLSGDGSARVCVRVVSWDYLLCFLIIPISIVRCNDTDLLTRPFFGLGWFSLMRNNEVTFAHNFLQFIVCITSSNSLNLGSIVRIYFIIFANVRICGIIPTFMINNCE